MRIIEEQTAREAYLNELKNRAAEGLTADLAEVRQMIDAVRREGDAAVRRYAEAFDGFCPERFEVAPETLRQAWDALRPELRAALIRAKERIRAYHRLQVPEDYDITEPDGSQLGLRHRGLDRVGLYVPGGSAAYPSTVLMNAIPAKLAGVGELIMVTPPKASGEGDVILAAAWLAGIDRVFQIGGAQAIAALAYGTETIPAVDKIVGPGNLFVAAAKRIVFGIVDIDSFAGPSEILIMADCSAKAEWLAADLLSQAEHDPNAAAILLTDGMELAEKVAAAVREQTETTSRRDIARQSLDRYGAILLCPSVHEMIALANRIAPEHLEIQMKDAEELLPEIRHAGAVFLGEWTPEALGDYLAGTNHVLPTAGTARFASPLGVYSFTKRMSVTRFTETGFRALADDVLTLTRCEALPAHGQAVRVRMAGTGQAARHEQDDRPGQNPKTDVRPPQPGCPEKGNG